MDWRLLLKERIAKIAKLRNQFTFDLGDLNSFAFWVTRMVCTEWELAGGGSVAVGRWRQMTSDR